jgi:hypothetical protein
MTSSGASDLGAADYQAIEEAVMESPRGRWFLGEYARRLRQEDNLALVRAMARLESALAANQSAIVERMANLLGGAPPATAPAPRPDPLTDDQLGYFLRDEDIFEPAAAMTGGDTRPEPGIVAKPPEPPELKLQAVVPPPVRSEPAKRRIVIIRHQPGEELAVPLQDDLRHSLAS